LKGEKIDDASLLEEVKKSAK